MASSLRRGADRGWRLSNGGIALRMRFERTGRSTDVDEAVDVHERVAPYSGDEFECAGIDADGPVRGG
ncbi:hypothetical protein ABT369_50465 [Dactylosporangium sp. NPDC000244]|uniref:hypothetical protein n=1 Tax=Dactylosporangium sp. NPDC000244 TaxID=3154365 RepID=UPI003326ABC9